MMPINNHNRHGKLPSQYTDSDRLWDEAEAFRNQINVLGRVVAVRDVEHEGVIVVEKNYIYRAVDTSEPYLVNEPKMVDFNIRIEDSGGDLITVKRIAFRLPNQREIDIFKIYGISNVDAHYLPIGDSLTPMTLPPGLKEAAINGMERIKSIATWEQAHLHAIDKKWRDFNIGMPSELVELSDEELIAEAKRRGFKKGVYAIHLTANCEKLIDSDEFSVYRSTEKTASVYAGTGGDAFTVEVYKNGEWSVITSKTEPKKTRRMVNTWQSKVKKGDKLRCIDIFSLRERGSGWEKGLEFEVTSVTSFITYDTDQIHYIYWGGKNGHGVYQTFVEPIKEKSIFGKIKDTFKTTPTFTEEILEIEPKRKKKRQRGEILEQQNVVEIRKSKKRKKLNY